MRRDVQVNAGTVSVRDTGRGPILFFVHGLFVNSHIWDAVVAELEQDFRCVLPDLPMGAHSRPLNEDADLSPVGLAQIIADVIGELDLEDVTLIGNDTGGAICQLVMTRHPQRLGRAVLTNCDAYENFLPPVFRPLQWAAHAPGFSFLFAQGFRSATARRLFLATVASKRVDPEVLRSIAEPFIKNPLVRRDATKVLQGISKRYTLEAAEHFGEFHQPVLLTWGRKDRFFKAEYAERMAAAFPNAGIEWIDDSKTFVQVDAPETLARAVQKFAAS